MEKIVIIQIFVWLLKLFLLDCQRGEMLRVVFLHSNWPVLVDIVNLIFCFYTVSDGLLNF